MKALLAIDQGTTSTRVIAFSQAGVVLCTAQKEHTQHYPHPTWVEHDPEELWQNTLTCLQQAYSAAVAQGYTPVAIGITNQRETTLAWCKRTGKCFYKAIVWQDKRTASFCQTLARTHGAQVKEETGLPLDPYFSASKMHWLLTNVPAVKHAAQEGTLAFGTVESFLLWRLTGGTAHKTDVTNASRTLLFNIHTLGWSSRLLGIFGVPAAALAEVLPNTAHFGTTAEGILPAPLPIAAMAGDQHAALFGQACFTEGAIKSTYGTGCFAMVNTAGRAVSSQAGLLTTLAYHLGPTLQNPATYALEGSIFSAGAGLSWLKDQLGLFSNAAEGAKLAQSADGHHLGLYFVPAFVGLGAPYWQSAAKGTLVGVTLSTDKAAITCAMLEAVAYQSCDLLTAMAADLGTSLTTLVVDGGMVKNTWFTQRLACLSGLTVKYPVVTETTAFGVALLAGLQIKMYTNLKQIAALWQEGGMFTPCLPKEVRAEKLAGWQKAINTTLYHVNQCTNHHINEGGNESA